MDSRHALAEEATQHTPRSPTDESGSGATPPTGGTPPDPSVVAAGGSTQTRNPVRVPHAPSAARHITGGARTSPFPQDALHNAADGNADGTLTKGRSFEEQLENLLAAEDRHRFQLECHAEDEMEDMCDIMISQEGKLLQGDFRSIDAEEKAEELGHHPFQRAREAAERGFLTGEDQHDAKSEPFHEDEEDTDARFHTHRQQHSKSIAVAAELEEDFESFHEAPTTELAARIERMAQPGRLPSSEAASPLTDTLNDLAPPSTSANATHEESDTLTHQQRELEEDEEEEEEEPLHPRAVQGPRRAAGRPRYDTTPVAGEGRSPEEEDEEEEQPLRPSTTEGPRSAVGRARPQDIPEAEESKDSSNSADDEERVEAPLAPSTADGAKRAAGRPRAPTLPVMADQEEIVPDSEDGEDSMWPEVIFGPSRAAGGPGDGGSHEAAAEEPGSQSGSEDNAEQLAPSTADVPKRAAGLPPRAGASGASKQRGAGGPDEEENARKPDAVLGPKRAVGIPPRSSHAFSSDAPSAAAGANLPLARVQSDYVRGSNKRHTSPHDRPGAAASAEVVQSRLDDSTRVGNADEVRMDEAALAAARQAKAARDHRLEQERKRLEKERARVAAAAPQLIPEPTETSEEEDEEDEVALKPTAIFGPTRAAGRPVDAGSFEAGEYLPKSNSDEEEEEPLHPLAVQGPRR
ncbi:hypothetical protein ABL78_6094, partial [Leptomonas seymouri]